jgi:U11/U12 small nuclear ribonucleoprotein SNRNP65
MNKYNMPPPFGPIEKESIPFLLKRKHDDLLASDESELEDEDDKDGKNAAKIQEEKVKQARVGRIAAEKQRLISTASGPTIAAAAAVSASSTSKNTQNVNKIKINIGKPTVKTTKNDHTSPTSTSATAEAISTVSPPRTEQELTVEQKLIRGKCISITELNDLPVFQNYATGAPSTKLYIKNLHQQVTQQDLVDIYTKFNPAVQVNLMKKGRLRGQAFITFPDEKSATLALTCTNGYPFYERPMVVVFGKVAE